MMSLRLEWELTSRAMCIDGRGGINSCIRSYEAGSSDAARDGWSDALVRKSNARCRLKQCKDVTIWKLLAVSTFLLLSTTRACFFVLAVGSGAADE
jgi:hypothetical protein